MVTVPVPGARRVPTGGDYVAALQDTGLCFHDAELRSAIVRTDALGRPRPISGNFASVFCLTSVSGRQYALKCFTRHVPDRQARYRAISDRLALLPAAWKVGFAYLPRAVLAGGEWHPVLLMEWVEATGLLPWIEGHLGEPGAIADLAGRFAALVADLEDARLAHGDLQHGNLLVAADGALRLIDYDGMYVHGLAGLSGVELGHRNYQSPRRSAADYGPRLDRFSAWVIYASLTAVAIDPQLWDGLHEPGGEHLLLTAEDFAAPKASMRFRVLLSHTDPTIRGLALRVRDLSGVPLRKVPRLEPVGRARTRRGAGATTPHASGPVPVPTAPVLRPASASALPAWMSGYVSPPGPQTPPSAPAPAQVAHGPAPAPVSAAGRRMPTLFPLAGVFPVRLVTLRVLGVLPAAVRTAVDGVTGLAGTVLQYRWRPGSGPVTP